MLTPGVPHRSGPAAHPRRVLLRWCVGDVGDRDLAPEARNSGLFDVARPRQPALDAVVHLFRAFVLDRDGEAGEVRGEGAAGQDVAVVLARVAVDGETAHRRVARVRERTEAEVIEELLAGIAAAHGRAALRTVFDRGHERVTGAIPPREGDPRDRDYRSSASRQSRLPST